MIETVVIVGGFLIGTATLFLLGKLISKLYPSCLFGTPWMIVVIMFFVVVGYIFLVENIAQNSTLASVLAILLGVNVILQLISSRKEAYFFDEMVKLLNDFIDHNFSKGEEITQASVLDKMSQSTEELSKKDKETLLSMYNACPEIIDFVLNLKKNTVNKSDLIKIYDYSKKLTQFRKKFKKDLGC